MRPVPCRNLFSRAHFQPQNGKAHPYREGLLTVSFGVLTLLLDYYVFLGVIHCATWKIGH